MVLNYPATNYIGWPFPAFVTITNYVTKVKKYLNCARFLATFLHKNIKKTGSHQDMETCLFLLMR